MPPREGVVYGVGALQAAARGDRAMWALHRAALTHGIVAVVPAIAVAQGFRSDAHGDRLASLLSGTELEELSAERARRLGELAARVDTDDLAAVAVAETADRRNGAVISGRQAALRNTAALLGHELVQHVV
jgi:hypothetical protein